MPYQIISNQAVDKDKYSEGDLMSRIHIVPMRVPRALRFPPQQKYYYHALIVMISGKGAKKGLNPGQLVLSSCYPPVCSSRGKNLPQISRKMRGVDLLSC